MSVAIEKSGIEGTLSRAVISTVMTLSRRPFELKVFGDRKDAAQWLGRHEASVPGDKLAALAARLEAELDRER